MTDIHGTRIWIVTIKGTFTANEDESFTIAHRQEEIYRIPLYSGDPGQSSLLYESDMTPIKPATDVILHGKGFTSMKVGLIEATRSREEESDLRFGPIAAYCSPRKELAGTFDEAWRKKRFPLPPLDFSDRFYQCAPEDQQAPGYLKGGETVELENAISGARLVFTLPGVSVLLKTHFTNSPAVEHSTVLQTVIIEPDKKRVMMVWAGSLDCYSNAMELMKTEIHGS